MMHHTSKASSPLIGLYAGLLMMGIIGNNIAQDIKTTLFREAKEAMETAIGVNAVILAPQNYGEAITLYRQAEFDYEKGKNLENIQSKLQKSSAYFMKAVDASKLAEMTFIIVIKARSDAQNADALHYAMETWHKAESKLNEAARKLEQGDIGEARKKGTEAEVLYRKAELEAIKGNYLNETRSLLAEADRQKVKNEVPKTLKRAQDLLAQAEKELEDNRYDTDIARGLAQQAKYEAKHAIYLSRHIREIKDSRMTLEDILLASEKPLQDISAEIDMVAEFDQGYDRPAQKIVEYLRQAEQWKTNLADREQRIIDLEARITELEEKLGGIVEEKSALKERIAAQERVREQFTTVEQMFTQEEARVLREGNDVIIRLVGLNFPVGKAFIEPKNFSLLTKVQNAINTFPGCAITIEGHTDSYGGDQANLHLSQKRADAVREYLLANMTTLDQSSVTAIGYGENKPIANNESSSGRAKNRRIDVVIHPQLWGAN